MSRSCRALALRGLPARECEVQVISFEAGDVGEGAGVFRTTELVVIAPARKLQIAWSRHSRWKRRRRAGLRLNGERPGEESRGEGSIRQSNGARRAAFPDATELIFPGQGMCSGQSQSSFMRPRPRLLNFAPRGTVLFGRKGARVTEKPSAAPWDPHGLFSCTAAENLREARESADSFNPRKRRDKKSHELRDRRRPQRSLEALGQSKPQGIAV